MYRNLIILNFFFKLRYDLHQHCAYWTTRQSILIASIECLNLDPSVETVIIIVTAALTVTFVKHQEKANIFLITLTNINININIAVLNTRSDPINRYIDIRFIKMFLPASSEMNIKFISFSWNNNLFMVQ